MPSFLQRLPVETYVIGFTVILWIVLSVAAPGFLTDANIANIMRQTSIAAIIAKSTALPAMGRPAAGERTGVAAASVMTSPPA